MIVSPVQLEVDAALKVAHLMRGETARIALRDSIIRALAEHKRGSLPERARALEEDLRAPDNGSWQSRVLATVRDLSRRKQAPTAHQIMRVLRRA